MNKPIAQFDVALEVRKSAAKLTGMQLMWAFYCHLKSFAITLGILENALNLYSELYFLFLPKYHFLT